MLQRPILVSTTPMAAIDKQEQEKIFVWLLLWGNTCRINSIDGSRWKRNCCTVLRGSKKDDDLMCHRSSVRVSMLVREGGKL